MIVKDLSIKRDHFSVYPSLFFFVLIFLLSSSISGFVFDLIVVEWNSLPGGNDCFSLSAFSLSSTTNVYKNRLQRTLNLTLSLFFFILMAIFFWNRKKKIHKNQRSRRFYCWWFLWLSLSLFESDGWISIQFQHVFVQWRGVSIKIITSKEILLIFFYIIIKKIAYI